MDTTIDEPLEAVKRTFSQAKKSKLYRRLSSYHTPSAPPSRIPLIQAGHCVFIVGNESFLEPVPDRLWSISKIPPHVRETDENEAYSYSYTYTPRLVSVGPVHYKKPGLEFMEAQKSRYLDRLLERCRGFILPDDLKTAMRELEEETREFYSEEFSHIDSDSFVERMLLDGCFVIEFLRFGGLTCQGKLADDPIFATRWMPLNLGVDLLLLENQLPLFVLHRLFDLTVSDDEYGCLVDLALRFFVNLSPGNNNAARKIESYQADDKSPHLLALFHNSFTPKSSGFHLHVQEEKSCCRHIVYAGKGWIQTAKILNLSGIRFKPKPGNILDIEFKKRDLNIPPIFIDHTRATVLKNLVAYEQHDRRAMPYFTSLVVFFSNILCTTDDVRILMKSGIIRQVENDEEEALKFFNGIVKDLVFDMNRCYLHKLIEDVNCTSQSFCAKFRSCFRTIINGINIIEIALLIISLVQTYLVVTSYFHPPG